MLDIAIAVSSGGLAFGNVPTLQGNVLYLALEDGETYASANERDA
jgi:hypothetical protein